MQPFTPSCLEGKGQVRGFKYVSVHPLPPTPSHVGEGELNNPLLRKALSHLVGEGWGGGLNGYSNIIVGLHGRRVVPAGS